MLDANDDSDFRLDDKQVTVRNLYAIRVARPSFVTYILTRICNYRRHKVHHLLNLDQHPPQTLRMLGEKQTLTLNPKKTSSPVGRSDQRSPLH